MDAMPWLERSREYGATLPPGSWQPLDAIGLPAPYVRTHPFEGEYINKFHACLGSAPLGRMGVPILIDIGIDGYLQRAEALKLYEMAYFSSGDIIELGTHKGLSTRIMAQAVTDSGSRDINLETIDIDRWTHLPARKNVGLWRNRWVKFTLMDATTRLDQLIAEGRKVGFIFVDHWHGYKETIEAAERAPRALLDGGYVMFHDFLDPGNNTPGHPYGVYAAVLDAFGDNRRMKFMGLCGSSAIFKYSEAG
jgi:predicted O-methyltransferase YrrM